MLDHYGAADAIITNEVHRVSAMSAFAVAIRSKADMPFCTAYVRL